MVAPPLALAKTVTTSCILKVGTVPLLYILNEWTVPMLCILNVGTVPTFSSSLLVIVVGVVVVPLLLLCQTRLYMLPCLLIDCPCLTDTPCNGG